ncbi:MAG: 5-(carboxyamino)imidazole ribonucleotide synthase [Gammaproteobacteria bacterium]
MSRKLGIIGAGQLGRMMALAGYPLGVDFRFLDHATDTPGGQVGDIVVGEFTDEAKLSELAKSVDVLSFDVENVSADLIRRITRDRPFYPPVDALATAQDRLSEKTLFVELGIATPLFFAVDSVADLDAAAQHVGLPLVLKTRRLGYDGRGQKVVRHAADLTEAFASLPDQPLIAEQFIEFDKEVSAIGVRSPGGDSAIYPLSHNVHCDGVLHYTTAPADDPALIDQARSIIQSLLAHFNYTGVLTIEFFVKDGQLIANEIAPRVHNSGHWTIEGAVTSQFENHVRAVLDMPLGSTAPREHSAMINFLGQMPDRDAIMKIPGAHYHDYGKTPRPGRKIGHCTVVSATELERDAALKQILGLLPAAS